MTVAVTSSDHEPSDVVLVEESGLLTDASWPPSTSAAPATTTRTPPSWLIPNEDNTNDATTAAVVVQGERLVIPEWEDDNTNNNNYRRKHGWCGRDLVHDRTLSPVHITDYFVRYGSGRDIRVVANPSGSTTSTSGGGGAGTVLQGIVVFTANAESHRGYCHGGSMCSIMDDCIGWVAFCVTGTCRPWTGFTVQVNTSLQQPVPVHATLLVEGRITRVERRKVYVTAVLYDPAKGGRDDKRAVHAVGEGMVVLNKGILLVEEEPTE